MAVRAFPLTQKKPLCTDMQKKKKNLSEQIQQIQVWSLLYVKRCKNHLSVKSKQELCNVVKISSEQPLLDRLGQLGLFVPLDWGKGLYLYYILLVQVLFLRIP